MKVKIGDKVYSYKYQPIMVILTEQDKKNISNMSSVETRYCCYPIEGWTTEEIVDWMSNDKVTEVPLE